MSTPAKRTRSEEKRQDIIDAAMRTFKEYGVAATSMDKLASEAKVSKRTVYNHFETKESLVMHLVSQLWMESITQESIVYDPNIDLQEQLCALVLSEINMISRPIQIDVARMAVGHLFYDTTGMNKEMLRLKALETAVIRWIKAATADGRLSVEDISFANDQILHLMKGHCFWPQIINGRCTLSTSQKSHLATETALMFLARYQIK